MIRRPGSTCIECSAVRSLVARIIAWAICLVPAGAASASPPLAAYGHLPGIEIAELSPSGQRYALIALVGNTRKLIVVGADGKPELSSDVGETKATGIEWADDDHVLVIYHSTLIVPGEFQRPRHGIVEVGMVAAFNVAEHRMVPLFVNSPAVARLVLGYYGSAHVDGHLYGYFRGFAWRRDGIAGSNDYALKDGYPDLFRIDLDSGTPYVVDEMKREAKHWVLAADGSVAAESKRWDESGLWRLYGPQGREQQLLEKKDPFGDIGLIGLGRTPGTIIYMDSTGDSDVLTEVAIKDGSAQELFADADTEGYLRDPDSRLLLGAQLPASPYVRFFDPALQARFNAARKAFPGYEVHLESYSRHLDRLLVKTDGNDDSGTWWRVDIASGKADPIGYDYPEIDGKDVGQTRIFDYKAGDGLAMNAVLTLPPGREARKLPLVVLPHGGPIGVHDRIGFDWWAQAFASAGYAVLQPNYRGSSGQGRQFQDAGYRQWGRGMQTDVSDGVAALAATGLIDSTRACIVGASYGGYAALAGVTLQQGIYRCAVAVGGLSNLGGFFQWQVQGHGRNSSATRSWRKVTGIDVDGIGAMSALSPSSFAARASGPVLLIHGDDDTVVPIEQSEIMRDALKSAKKPVEFVRLKDEDHWLSRSATRTAMLQASVAFVRKHNPPD